MVPVVQLVRASDCGSECRGFESHRAPKEIPVTEYVAGIFCKLLSDKGKLGQHHIAVVLPVLLRKAFPRANLMIGLIHVIILFGIVIAVGGEIAGITEMLPLCEIFQHGGAHLGLPCCHYGEGGKVVGP